MKLTAKGRYAVTALVALARHERAVSLRVLAEEQGISLAFLQQVFAQLRRAGLVDSVPGKSGGYRLAHHAGHVTVGQIIEAVDIDIRAQGCSPDQRVACTGKGERCLTHDLWHALEDHIGSFLSRVTVEDILQGRVGVGERVGEMA